MTRSIFALLLASGLAASAWGQSTTDDAASTAWWRPYVGVGYTFGGDTLDGANLIPVGTTTRYEEDISAGAGLDLRLGMQLRLLDSPLSIKATVAHHVDGASGLNGKMSFRRNPLELGASWQFTPRFSAGAGVRHSVRAKFHSDGFTCTDNNGQSVTCATVNVKFKGSVGAYAEIEWLATPNWGLQFRAVHENVTVNDPEFLSTRFNADHIGFMTVFYFR